MNQFKGMNVVELASVLAGPSVGQFFAELGADVIKVENLRTGGDVTRSWKSAGERTDDRSAYFCSVNWGKRSIAVDLTTAEGRRVVHQLCARAEIVIASYKPGDDKKLGVDYEALRKFNGEIIYGQITGYGSDNPRVGYDAIIQAEAGFMYMNGEPGGRSLKIPVALMDVLAGHHLKEGLLLAMLEKTKTGKGKLVEVSLIQSAVASLANQATNWLIGKKHPGKHGSAHPNIAPYGDVFITADGQELLLAVGNDGQFQALCVILGIQDLSLRKEFSTNIARVENRDALRVLLSEAIGKFQGSFLVGKLNEFNVPGGLIQSVEQALDMPEVQEMFLRTDHLVGLRTLAVHGQSVLNILPPPHFGQHTAEILAQLDI